jgi:hypothetical protein
MAAKRAREEERLLKVGAVARLTGPSVKTLHHYEGEGLAEPAGRTEAGYRLYGEEEVARLRFIRRAKLLVHDQETFWATDRETLCEH